MRIQSFTNGLLAGLILGILFAPDAGRETRRRIVRKANDVKDAACDTYDSIVETVSEQYDRVKNKAREFVGKEESMISGLEDDASGMFE